MNVLFIDTSSTRQVTVRLRVGNDELIKESKQTLGSQALLDLIDQALKDGGIKKEDLGEIKVNTGPGSFTGLRVGVSVANALAFALKIPINGKRVETLIKY